MIPILGLAVALAIGFVLLRRYGVFGAAKASGQAASEASSTRTTSSAVVSLPFRCEVSSRLKLDMYRLALGDFDPESALNSAQLSLLKSLSRDLSKAVKQKKYFPRRPQLLPQLLRVLRDEKSGAKEVVNIISQDPVLTGNVLRMANSSYYRTANKSIDGIQQAVILLGEDGLRTLMSATIMQPVFSISEGAFEGFSKSYWSQALLSAEAAKRFAKTSRECDSFSAHFYSLLGSIGYTVLLRLVLEQSKQNREAPLSTALLVRVFETQLIPLTALIAKDWELGPDIELALKETQQGMDLDKMGGLSRALYYGRLVGTAALLVARGQWQAPQALALFAAKGLSPAMSSALWTQVLALAEQEGKR
jgi:HD-like signal output (HDOD) protein